MPPSRSRRDERSSSAMFMRWAPGFFVGSNRDTTELTDDRIDLPQVHEKLGVAFQMEHEGIVGGFHFQSGGVGRPDPLMQRHSCRFSLSLFTVASTTRAEPSANRYPRGKSVMDGR
jgi:hypothetical protein